MTPRQKESETFPQSKYTRGTAVHVLERCHSSFLVLHKLGIVVNFVLLRSQRRIQEFPRGAPTPRGRQHTILPNFPENCMKSKEFGRPGGGGGARPLNPPLVVKGKLIAKTLPLVGPTL